MRTWSIRESVCGGQRGIRYRLSNSGTAWPVVVYALAWVGRRSHDGFVVGCTLKPLNRIAFHYIYSVTESPGRADLTRSAGRVAGPRE